MGSDGSQRDELWVGLGDIIKVAFGGEGGWGIYSGSDFSSGTLCSGPPEGWGLVRVRLGVEWVTC